MPTELQRILTDGENPPTKRIETALDLLDGLAVRLMLVYQAGIANVFRVECFNLASYGRHAHRLYQGDFRGAVTFVNGAAAAGAIVRTAACNQAGDIARALWSEDLDAQPFSDSIMDVRLNGGA